jgi:hypothetical protein
LAITASYLTGFLASAIGSDRGATSLNFSVGSLFASVVRSFKDATPAGAITRSFGGDLVVAAVAAAASRARATNPVIVRYFVMPPPVPMLNGGSRERRKGSTATNRVLLKSISF